MEEYIENRRKIYLIVIACTQCDTMIERWNNKILDENDRLPLHRSRKFLGLAIGRLKREGRRKARGRKEQSKGEIEESSLRTAKKKEERKEKKRNTKRSEEIKSSMSRASLCYRSCRERSSKAPPVFILIHTYIDSGTTTATITITTTTTTVSYTHLTLPTKA